MLKKIMVLSLASTMAVACASGTTPQMKKKDIGSIGGAVIGGVLGSNVGGGKGQMVAVGVGTLLGALAGSSIGSSLDRADEMYAQRAWQQAHTAPVGDTITWTNPESGNRGSYTPQREGRTNDNRSCREYEQTIIIDGQAETGVGIACQNNDGTWDIANN